MSASSGEPTRVRCPACNSDVSLDLETTCVTVCAHCLSVLERSSVGLRAIGVSGKLRDHGSKLHSGLRLRIGRSYVNVMGRTQPEDSSGNRWDEWYVEQDDGTWAWLAEDQGRYFLTEPLGGGPTLNAAEVEALQPGERVMLRGEAFTVDERDQSVIRAAEGQIPFFFRLDETSTFVDLSGQAGRFATLDASHDPPRAYVGREVQASELVFPHPGDPTYRAPAPTGARVAVEGKCGGCTFPLKVWVPAESVRVFCTSCGEAHDIDGDAVRHVRGVGREIGKRMPFIPFGSEGELFGEKLTLVGWVRRVALTAEGEFPWDEHLMAVDGGGFRWLVLNQGTLTLGRPIPAGQVVPLGARVAVQGVDFEPFTMGKARTERAAGEFPWRLTPGEVTETADWTRPPYAISREQHGTEANWVLARHVDAEAFEAGFPGRAAPTPAGVGMAQPFKHAAALRVSLYAALVAFGIFAAQRLSADNRVATRLEATIEATATEATPQSIFGEPFMLNGGEAITVRVASGVRSNWAFVDGALVNSDTGVAQPFGIEVSQYSGVDGGESWSEGDPNGAASFSALPPGPYTLQLNVIRGPERSANTPSIALRAEVVEGDPSFGWPLLVFLVIGAATIVLLMMRSAHDRQRFAHSDFPRDAS